ncbi:hypothetical protein PE067_03835 [Paracoccus sp. DMF-8]|nr:hypothetical protein [Paracoccus sp. DMF-8]MDF3605364.1 hypothetical protein [Paracoccus sp. DMF-8]
MQSWKPDERTRQIDVLLFDRFSNLCLANAVERLLRVQQHLAQAAL